MDDNHASHEYKDFPIQPFVLDGVLHIDVPLGRLQTICDDAWRNGVIPRRCSVDIPLAAANDFIEAMTNEEADGTTLLDEFFDRVVRAACHIGPLGIGEYPAEEKPGA